MDIPPWSYSSLNKFLTCPRQYELVRVKKAVIEPQGEAAAHGEIVHRHLELRVQDGTPLPESLQQWEPMVAKFAAADAFTEKKYAIDSAFSPVEWYSAGCWSRGIIDVGIVNGKKAALFDYKTGKRKPGSSQLRLSAAFIMHTHPNVQVVNTGFIWLKEEKVDKETITREQLPEVWQEFLPSVRRLEQAYQEDKWMPKPSGLCKGWCPVPKHMCSFKEEKR